MRTHDYKEWLDNKSSEELMDINRTKLREFPKEELFKVCCAMLSSLIDLKRKLNE